MRHSFDFRSLRGILGPEFLLCRFWIDLVALELFSDLVLLRLAAVFRVRFAIAFVPTHHVVHL